MTYRIPLACCLGALLALVGCDGESPVERPDGCVPAARDHVTCSDGDLYWVDSCGARGELSQGCDAPCAPGATTCPDPEDPTSLYLEAEEGTVMAPFAIAADPDASKGRYVSVSGVPSTSTPQTSVTHPATLPESGDWHLWARVLAPSPDADAMYLGLDGELARVFPEVHGAYTWIAAPAPVRLEAGEHVVSVGHGEAGIRVDAFVLTLDPDRVPSTIPSASCGNGWVESPETCEGASACCDAATCTTTADCGPTVVLRHRKAFPDLWGEGAGEIRGGSGAGSVKFFITSLGDAAVATAVPAAGGVEAHYEGTLRGALGLAERRHIIPRVSGNVMLSSRLIVRGAERGGFTYHGHLAPEGGLATFGQGLVVQDTQDFAIRFLRARFGAHSRIGADDVVFLTRNEQVAIDHCSFAWGADETFTIGGAIGMTYVDVIAQNNLIAQSRDGHNTGSLIGWTSEGDGANGVVTWHDNVYVGVTHRTPNFAGDSGMFGRIHNNVVYDWSHRLTNVIGAARVDVSFNYYLRGARNPSVPASNYNQYQDLRGRRPYPPSLYSAGNLMPGVVDDPAADNRALWSYFGSSDPLDASLFRADPLPIDPDVGHQPSSAEDAYARHVLAREVGANRSTDAEGAPVVALDAVDEGYLAAIEAGTDAHLPESAWVNPDIPDSPAYEDANWNGIADAFEDAHGVTSADEVIVEWSFDGYRVVNEAGYDAFEIYSAWVAGDFARLLP